MYVLPGEIDESERKATTDTSWVEQEKKKPEKDRWRAQNHEYATSQTEFFRKKGGDQQGQVL